MLRRVPFLLSAAALVACSSSAVDGDGDEANLTSGEAAVCATLDYGHTRSNAETYIQFPDDAAALDFARGFLEANSLPPAREISTDVRLNKLVTEVYAGFKKVFPKETEGLDVAPRVVIVESDEVNAFAGFDDRSGIDKGPWLLFVHSKTLASPSTDSELRGLFGHELGHLVLRNVLPETRAKIRSHYLVRGSEHGVIGSATTNDPTVEKRVAEYKELGAKVGRVADLGPLPHSPEEQADYEAALGVLLGRRASSPDPASCESAAGGFRQIVALEQGHVSPHEHVLAIDDAQRESLRSLGRSTADAIRKCLAHETMSLLELKVRAKGASLPPADLDAVVAKALDPSTPEHAEAMKALMTNDVEREVEKTDAAKPTIDRVLEIAERLHQRVHDLQADPAMPVDAIRVFDAEEDADDAAIRVLSAIGDDPLGVARFFVGLLPDPAACQRDVAAGKVPSYGRFLDAHNDTCWRWFHAVELSSALKTCGSQPKPSRAATGSETVSPYDDKKMIDREAAPKPPAAKPTP